MVGTAPVEGKIKEVKIKAKIVKAKVRVGGKITGEVKIKAETPALGRGKV